MYNFYLLFHLIKKKKKQF